MQILFWRKKENGSMKYDFIVTHGTRKFFIKNKVVVGEKDKNGNLFYYSNGDLHRENGPAIEWSDGTKEWYVRGVRHRSDGPAVIYPSNTKAWYKNGIYTKTEYPDGRVREVGKVLESKNHEM